MSVITARQPYDRQVRPKTFSIDLDALQLLQEWIPTAKSHGRFVSELIRAERVRREERERVRRALESL